VGSVAARRAEPDDVAIGVGVRSLPHAPRRFLHRTGQAAETWLAPSRFDGVGILYLQIGGGSVGLCIVARLDRQMDRQLAPVGETVVGRKNGS
jgi:hypothetical protein